MVEGINSASGANYTNPTPQSATKEKNRVGYNAQTKTFNPLSSSDTKKIEHLEQVENTVKKFSPSNPHQQSVQKKTHVAKKLDIPTKNVGGFFAGNASHYGSFISTIKTSAQSL